MDIEDLKLRYFDYIWLNQSTHDFRDFKKIFSDITRWKKFNSRVKKAVMTPLPTFDEYREKNTDATESQVSKIRENDYKEVVGKELNKAFGDERAIIVNRETEETPWRIIDQIEERIIKLEKVVEEGSKDVVESEEFYQRVKNLLSQIGHVKQRLD